MSGFLNNKTDSLDTNAVSRIRNLLVGAIHMQVQLPKLIVVVPDNDIIEYIDYRKYGAAEVYAKFLDWIMTQQERLIASQKEYLPLKARQLNYPQIIWIEPPLHDNFDNNTQRAIFGNILSNTAQFYDGVSVLQLKKIWDEKDTKLFVKENKRFTADGMKKYWEAVDKTVKYADTIGLQKQARLQKAKAVAKDFKQKHEKYKWKRSEH